MTHEMHLKPSPFQKMKEGQKTIELRLHDPKRQAVRVGDLILFFETDHPLWQIKAKVKALHRFASFEDLYASLPLTACGYDENTLADASYLDMERYYTKEEQAQYGVVGIEIDVLRE